MRLTPHEIEKTNVLTAVCNIAQRRLASGLRLNLPEAEGLIAGQMIHLARSGNHTVAQIMNIGRNFLGRKQVLAGIAEMLEEVQVEATFMDGSKLITLHHPVCCENGDLALALLGSFLPVPDLSLFAAPDPEEGLIPGQIYTQPEPILLNKGRNVQTLSVINRADRPIQVGSHYHFIETNAYLDFDRMLSYGMRLNIPAGTSVRFEPGERKDISLVSIAGNKVVRGGNDLCNGPVSSDPAVLAAIRARIAAGGFSNTPAQAPSASSPPAAKKARKAEESSVTSSAGTYEGNPMARALYARMYGPTTGDVIRLGDTELYVRVEADHTVYGDEGKFGGGKVLREGMGQATGLPPSAQLDTVLTNALIIDYTGIYKADIGLKDGNIAGIGKAGNPDVMEGVTLGMVVGVNTESIAAEGLIVTAGGMDAHVHFICPGICDEALSSGLTTMLGGGTGPASGTCATTCTPGPMHVKMMLQATDVLPMNMGFTGKGNTASSEGLTEVIAAGAVGLKLHEDWGSTPAAINACLTVADNEDIQVTIHTDTLNESGCVEHSIKAIGGRTIHTYHTEGAGGGHAPDIICIAGEPNVIPSSTNPTRPLTINTMDEHLDMLMVCHHLDKNIPEDISFAESRIRKETVAAEDILQDMGAISIISSDSMAMGRVGEVICRTWQTADKMKRQRGQLAQDKEADAAFSKEGGVLEKTTDNYRVRRYVAKYTINPCVAHGMSHIIGSVEVGKLADLVLWKPSYFGAKPEMIIKGGNIAYSQMGDANASIPTPQPVFMRPMFGAMGKVASKSSIAFVSQSCAKQGIAEGYGLEKPIHPVIKCRDIGKKDMKLNDWTGKITVDPETYQVVADGELLTCLPAEVIPLARRYFLH